MTIQNELFEKVKRARLQRFFTNCYSSESLQHAQEIWEDGDSFLFSWADHGVKRLVFYARDYAALDQLLQQPEDVGYVLELMTKVPAEYVPSGFDIIAALKRLANADCRSVLDDPSGVLRYRNDCICEMACVDDAHEVNQLLWATFNTEISHLLTDEELAEWMNKGQVFIHRDPADAHIDAVLHAEILPKKFYINQVINRADRSVIHAILLQQLRRYVQNGGKYLYSWVDENNIASVKFHGKYGMTHDGMWNMVYKRSR